MASLNLPYTLSAEDAAVFTTLQDSALLPELAKPGKGEMVELFKQKKYEEQRALLAPYADILEAELKKMLEQRKSVILQKLKESKGTAFTVELFSWTTVHYHESLSQLKKRESEMGFEERHEHYLAQRKKDQLITANKWETMFGTEYGLVYGYGEDDYPDVARVSMKVDRIFRFSDLTMRLSLALGPNFYPFMRWVNVMPEPFTAAERRGYFVYKKVLCVRYYPFGVSKLQMDKLLACAKTQAQRLADGEKISLTGGEYPVGHEEMCVLPLPARLGAGRR